MTSMSTDFSSSSESSLLHTSLTWKINNFSFRDTFVKSSAFSDEKKNTFNLGLHPNINGFVRLDIIMAAKQSIKIKYKFSLVNSSGNKRLLYDQMGSLAPTTSLPNSVVMSIPKFISRTDLLKSSNGYLPGDTLTLHCEIVHLDKETNLRAIPSQGVLKQTDTLVNAIVQLVTLQNDYCSLLKTGNLTDVKLIVGGKTFTAHKLILSARSPVFAAMFSHDTKEKMENQVEILDIEPKAFEAFLFFLYTGGMPTLESIKSAEDLLIVADKYDCGQLKTVCEEFLINQLTISTAPNLLLLANTVSANKLKQSALEFIRSRGSELFDALKSNPEQMINLFQILAKKGESKNKEEKTSQTEESESMNGTGVEDTAKGEKRKLLVD